MVYTENQRLGKTNSTKTGCELLHLVRLCNNTNYNKKKRKEKKKRVS
jgi:hypothetical protein